MQHARAHLPMWDKAGKKKAVAKNKQKLPTPSYRKLV
jgi:hypothetical protein